MHDTNEKFTQEFGYRKEGEQVYLDDQDALRQANDLHVENTKNYNEKMDANQANGVSK